MSLSFIGVGGLVNFTGATNITVPIAPGTAAGDLILISVAVQNALPGSVPLVDADLSGGWVRIASRRPASTGSAVEVWAANYLTGPVTFLALHGAYNGIAGEVCYRCTGGEFGQVVSSASREWAGSDPVWPSVASPDTDNVVLAVGAQTLTGSGFTFPVGWNTRRDNAYLGAFGNAELVIKDIPYGLAGDYGTIPTTAPATSPTAEGALITLMLSCGSSPVVGRPGALPLLGVG